MQSHDSSRSLSEHSGDYEIGRGSPKPSGGLATRGYKPLGSPRELDDRNVSPEPPTISLIEANPDLGDEYGVSAVMDRDVDSVADSVGSPLELPLEQSASESLSLPMDGEPGTPTGSVGLARSRSPLPPPSHDEAIRAPPSEVGLHKMCKFSLYETAARYYLVGADLDDSNFRVVKIDRTAPPSQLSVVEDQTIYSKRQMHQLLNAIDDGNKNAGGMKLKSNCWGLLGFIRFTEAYYMLIITKRQQVALIGGHFIYQVDGTDLIPLTTGPASKTPANRNPEEQRYLGILNNLDLHRSFYFSYSYNVTRTMQHNIIRDRSQHLDAKPTSHHHDFNDMFVWNHHLLDPALQHLKNPYHWCLPIIHGFVDQSCVDLFGRSIYITLIARRSRFFAGARFLKRGANDLGYVANDVETEQIVTEMVTTSLNAPRLRLFKTPSYTSFVQHRGSIPLYWTQDNTGVTPKPGIDLNFIDPFYASAGLHFDHLFERYGAPITVLNLIRARERTPRESKLLVEYQNAIAYLNQSLPTDKKILYRAFDMAKAAKTRGQDVIGSLETIAQDLVHTSGFFHNGLGLSGETSVQNGVTRSNCIDCLDRTNACQFVIGKTAFALQLQALGLIAGDSIDYDSDASNILAHMYNDHGDTLASQYGGSHLVNTTDSYRKISNWQSHSRDMLESFKRYYHNSFLDNQRQEAYNLFLGNYRYASGQPMLWELPNDFYLHHTNPMSFSNTHRRDYVKWFTPEFLEKRSLPIPEAGFKDRLEETDTAENDWWEEYYRPGQLTTFAKTFAYRINSTTRYLPKHSSSANFDRSPFVVRKDSHDTMNSEIHKSNNLVGFTDVNSREAINPLSATSPPRGGVQRVSSLQQWLQGPHRHDEAGNNKREVENAQNKSTNQGPPKTGQQPFVPADKNLKNQWTLRQFQDNSLHPSVTEDEMVEYKRYISHPLKLPLVISGKPSSDSTSLDFQEYIDSVDHVANAAPEYGAFEGAVEYERWVDAVPEDALCATEEDLEKKRYQAYRKWLKGKSLFKQSKVDPEFDIEV